MIATVMQSLPVTLLVEGGIFVTLAVGLRLSRRDAARRETSRVDTGRERPIRVATTTEA